jgi:transposase InsO family protein
MVVVSEVVQNFCARVGTEKHLASPSAPQTDGMIERFNVTL